MLTWRQRLQRVVLATPADHQRDDLRIQRRATTRDPADCVCERGHVGDSVLQEIADAACVLADEVQCVGFVAKLDSMRMPVSGCARRIWIAARRTVVGLVRRHLHVDDCDVRTVRRDLALQVDRVPA